MNIKFDKKEKSMNIKNKRGITLVSLVITIIILLILAGIGINALKQTNLFEQSKQAKNSMSNAQNIENNTLLSYESMINDVANTGKIYNSMSTNETTLASQLDNQRQQVMGVASDEELSNMIKFQQAYNASSRFINVIDDMIQTLINNLGVR